jgi:shikimate dehydrogenase
VCLWGGGATAASLLASLALIEAGPAHVHVRSIERARAALAIAGALGYPATSVPWATGDACGDADLTVVTVPATAIEPVLGDISGMASPGHALFDVSYDPLPSALATAWANRLGSDATVVSGLDLLVHQAVGQIQQMTGRDASPDILRAAAEAELAARARS